MSVLKSFIVYNCLRISRHKNGSSTRPIVRQGCLHWLQAQFDEPERPHRSPQGWGLLQEGWGLLVRRQEVCLRLQGEIFKTKVLTSLILILLDNILVDMKSKSVPTKSWLQISIWTDLLSTKESKCNLIGMSSD